MRDDPLTIGRRELLASSALAAVPVSAGAVAGRRGRRRPPDDYDFYDDWEDGDYATDPAWGVFLSEGDFDAAVVETETPDGGNHAIEVTETTGGGTSGVIGWDEGMGGWSGEWTLTGAFRTETVPLSTPFQTHGVEAYRDPNSDRTPLRARLGFLDGNGGVVPFAIDGDLVDSVEASYDPGWEENAWYNYEIRHDGDGTYTGRLWKVGDERPSAPNARSVGDPPGGKERSAAIRINGARRRDFRIRHSHMGWRSGGRQTGYYGRYYNLTSDHPDMEGGSEPHEAGLVRDALPLRLTDRGEEVYDRFDWYGEDRLVEERVDAELRYDDENYLPVDEDKAGDPFHFAAHWTATVVAPDDGEYEFVLGSDDDSWLFLNGELAVDNGGKHSYEERSAAVSLDEGENELDLFFAERKTRGSNIYIEPDPELEVFPREPDPVRAEVTAVDWPPAAIDLDHAPGVSVTVDVGDRDPGDVPVSVDGRAVLYRRDERVGEVEIQTIGPSVTEDGLLEAGGFFPAPSDTGVSAARRPGLNYRYDLTLSVDGTTVLNVDPDGVGQSYAFRDVDRVAGIAAKASDQSASDLPTSGDLYGSLRAKAEYLNEFYASGLGNMGAKGFDVEFVTSAADGDAVDGGWITLDESQSEYRAETYALDFLDEALATAHERLDVEWGQYQTALVLNEELLSNPFWMGEIPPALSLSFPWFDVEYSLRDFDLPVEPRPLPDDASREVIDAMYVSRTGDAWRHEFGHAMGPELQIGFPELYDPEGMNNAVANWGVVGDWGIMGTDGDVVTGVLRSLFGETPWNNPLDNWLDIDPTLHVVDDQTVETESPLTEKELGDSAEYLFSPYANFSVDVDVDWPSLDIDLWDRDVSLDPGDVDVDVEEADAQLGMYIVEERRSEETSVEHPTDGPLSTSPDGSNHGVALYRFDTIEVEGLSTLRSVVDPDEDVELSLSPRSLELEYLPPEGSGIHAPDTDVTLSTDDTEYVDPLTASTFELVTPPSAGDPEVEVRRDVSELVENLDDVADRAVSIVVDFVSEYLEDELGSLESAEDPLPGLEVLAVTPDGERAGITPSGEVVTEIEGSRVRGTPGTPVVTVPGDASVDVRVTAERIKDHLREDGYEPPRHVPYERTVVVDDATEPVENDDVASIEGRTSITAPGVTGGETEQNAVVGVPADVSPNPVPAGSNGRWLTASVGLPDDVAVEDIQLSSVSLAGVSAIHDDQYGFVRNPPVHTEDGRRFVEVKFPRDEVVSALGTGSHEVQILGVAEWTTLRGTTTLEVRQRGNGKSGSNSKGKGR